MKTKSIIYLAFIGLIGLLSSCEKDGTNIKILNNPNPPTITVIPDLTLLRTNAAGIVEFQGTPVDPGFAASATYFLEVCLSGTGFSNPLLLYSGIQDSSIKFTVMDLNGLLLKKFPADQVTSVDFRLRAVLSLDAGTGALGTGTRPLQYSSNPTTADISIYGLPRLDLINSGITQKIESALSDGNYIGFVKLDATKPFTLKNPDANITYGGTGGVLSVNGAALSVTTSGWYQLTASTVSNTYSNDAYMIGLIGDATPNGWSAPDSKLDYDASTGSWVITLNLTAGSVKFRKNDSWNSGLNLGLGTGYSLDNLFNDGSSSNIPLPSGPGNYTVRLYIDKTPYKCSFTKNN
jgi:hypothetical protein